jgi:integrase
MARMQGLSVESWLEYWLENVSRPFVKQSTYEGYRAAVRVHLIPGIGRHRLASLRPEHLERLYVAMLKIQTRRGTLMSPGRVHQVHRTISTALNEAARRGYLDRNPAELAKTPPMIEQEVEPYSVLEVQQLIEAAKRERNGVRWVLALVLGLRQGEALGLKWDDIDWMTGPLSVKRSRTRPRYEHGCQPNCGHQYAGHCPARQNARPATDTTKSRAGKRIVPCPARSSSSCWLTEKLNQWNDGEPLNFGRKKAGSSQTRLVMPSIPEPTGTHGSVYLQPLASAMDASTMPLTPQLQNFCCSAFTSARS